ncbi:MAG: OmpW family protein [Nitrosomonadales bacterium]|nr:OmpW family protein [Nitrosomonadales bacterium]
MKKILLGSCCSILILFFFASLAIAKEGDVVVRLRATAVIADEQSNLYAQTQESTGLAAALYGTSDAKLDVNSNVIPEIDFSYYLTDNIAAELILALGTRHDVKIKPITSSNNADLGSINILPPTLTIQWHFNPDESFDPYLGVGATYARVMDNRLDLCCTNNLPIHVERNNFGPTIQAGFDFNIDDTYLLNADVKRSWIKADVTTGDDLIDELDINPWIVSVGVGMRF